MCCVSIETYCRRDQSLANRCVVSEAMVSLGRNEFRDTIIRIDDRKCGKRIREFTLLADKLNYKLNTRFVAEGKASVTLMDPNVRIFLSNCPSNQLSLFLKCFVFKCDYYKRSDGHTSGGQDIRRRLVADKQSVFDEMSPLTDKDIKRNVLLKSKQNERNVKTVYESPKSTKTYDRKGLTKRKLAVNDENRSPGAKRAAIAALIPSPVRHMKLLNENGLTNEQRRVMAAVVDGRNVFFTGSAGTGKSFLLRFIIARLAPDTTYVTASTGIAASHIGGMTLHMFTGLTPDQSRKGTAEECAKTLMANASKLNRWRKCKCLVIDEISMVCGKYFQLVDSVAKIVRNCDQPFGGIQVVVCGDFLQLPPITRRDEEKCFAFQSASWDQCITNSFELSHVKRQTDKTFIKLLQNIRIGNCDQSMTTQILNTYNNDLNCKDLCPTRLFTHRNDVDLINTKQLNSIDSKAVVFTAEDSDPKYAPLFDGMCPTARTLELKVGAQVMLNRNIDVGRGLVNGLNGKVMKMEREKSDGRLYPRIQFVNGCEAVIKRENWVIRVANDRFVSRRHLPLQLSWALSIHKSQGMTIDNGVEISLARVFECGQTYVALSRCKTLSNIRIIDFNPNSVIVDSNALHFYNNLKFN
ncbi:unnamed protein product [Medioppia subpectinata]|uniref:ATP-dependent DNA helicase n=1 Tax=Medioppia subpectinata TaxID=1979941 RepID=A0A7R9PU21_9ACAR|nr:unnamed protein product [Medioppia subpectinata]CAG2101112.1 unnamed protein product [Medioppia subpectinata]